MDTKGILDALLERSQQASAVGIDLAERSLGVDTVDERAAMLKGLGGGAAAAGALALVMGSKKGRKFAKKAMKVGGTAAIGGLAYKAWSDWQTQRSAAAMGAPGGTPAAGPGTPIGELVDHEAEKRGEALIRAMITAARVDGHIDARERQLIGERLAKLELERDVASLLMQEIGEPVEPARIAALADSPEAGAELYIASALVVDRDDAEGRLYLDGLARALELEPGVTALLEAPLRER